MRKRARLVNAWTTNHAGVVLIILALVSAFQLSYFSYHNRQVSSCQSRYNIAMAETLQTRSHYADQDRESLVTFIHRVSEAKSRTESRDALNDYLSTQERIDRERRSNPLPKLPPGKCS